MDKKLLKCRAKDAAYIEQRLQTAFKNLDKIPSYTGKARFMDIICDALNRSHVLAITLKEDSES
ncbi:MAG: hypothetical protein LBH01_02065 [Verrucomicrobiales bacterium]|nr:hypothetical protein [Verrucomicrobiales bacterium]